MTSQQYIESINQRFKLGNATEHTFRGDLARLIETLVPEIVATNEPKRQSCGAPDYILTKNDIPVGFIEAKDIGDKDLDGNRKTGNKEQFDRYKASLNNLLFTDYLSFHLYREGEFITKISIAEVGEKGIKPLPENFGVFENLIKDFCTHVGQTIKSPKKLAEMMAGKARLLSDVIGKSLTSDEANQENSTLKDQMNAFRDILIHDITPRGFADVYAQTIAYGMFAARLHDPTLPTFSRQEAAELIPKSNPFLRKLFGYIAGPDIDDRIKWIVDSLIDIFLACNVEEILKNYGKSTKMEDPIIHFYETFLSEYDPKLRKARGVWYTPAPVVNFIVRAVDDVLKTEFGLSQGLADTSQTKITLDTQNFNAKKQKYDTVEKEVHKVQILDPATGTGTFLAEVIKHIHKKFEGQQGIWSNYVEKHLLPRLNGFELLMASYAMAHLQIDLLLKETGYKATTNERLKVYLTNSLEESHPDTNTLFANWLSDEANEANRIKRDTPVMVILGNPPYSGESANKGEWIMKLMEDYKKEPGGKEKLNERNPKWINDDYVKFLRYGQHFIEKNGSGILAFINPHGFLDNPTFRGMRWNLLKTYDKFYTIDLHGNSKKKETAPDGSADQNVFDIMQGVSLNIFIKTGKKKADELGKVYHYDLFGKRDLKYDFLSENSLKQIEFTELPNVAPNYFFVNKNFGVQEEYDLGFKVNELFSLNNVGIVTARDNFTIHNSKEDVKKTIDEFLSLDDEIARQKFNLGKDVRDWQVGYAKNDLLKNYPDKGKFAKISYRPFDERWTFYTGNSKGFHCYPRNEVMKHFLKDDNLGLVFKLGNAETNSVSAMVTKNIIDFRSWSRPGMQGGDYVSPLYLYPETTLEGEAERIPNLNMEIVEKIGKNLGLYFAPERPDYSQQTEETNQFYPEDILDYIYAVLHSPGYREKYKEFLKIDFPRVPYPKDAESFWKLVELGREIREIHLLESPLVEQYITQYPEDGDNVVDKPVYKDGKVYINSSQYFAGVPEIAWNFYIGGYQPAQKWLKDRKGRTLDFEDILHYQKIIVALAETDRLMKEVDGVMV
ncbi:N-6 DNA methylase [Elizabethkingia anophelis]|uniref:type ISP restriction/modification enzyme n=1 Tax=Elizabethkingia anophelis TaxID=1117645 RepID=UPI003891D5A4|nr:N-6 DNA methylase [Elizabethkingia anophelis]MCT4146113.1 N-6 DNA methylase [Elizabethkingia anophelis]